MSSGRRAVIRWSTRMFRRDWRQQLLVLAMITVTVAGSVTGTTMVVSGSVPPTSSVTPTPSCRSIAAASTTPVR